MEIFILTITNIIFMTQLSIIYNIADLNENKSVTFVRNHDVNVLYSMHAFFLKKRKHMP